MFPLVLSSACACALLAVVMFVRERRACLDAARLDEQLREVTVRLTAAEQSLAQVAVQAEITSRVLLDKGVADEEDLDAARRQFNEASQGDPARRDGSVH